MSKVIKLSTNELETIIRKVIYEQRLYDYTKFDYIDIAIDTLKTWLKDTKNLTGKFPMSYLINKYYDEFTDFIFANRPTEDKERFKRRNNHMTTLELWGQEIVSGGVVSDLPTLGSEEFFTKKFERFLPRVWQMMELPEWLKVDLIEGSPSHIKMNLIIDYPKMIKSPTSKFLKSYEVTDKFKKILTKYFGITFGRVIEGNVLLQINDVVFNGLDEWIRKDLNKEIKKEVRTLPGSEDLHSMKFEPPTSSDFKSAIKLVMKKYRSGREIRDRVDDLLKSKGYNRELIRTHY
jgi:hypothetical protein